ncbi:Efflux pump patC [Cladobotryum mycophilum]|uniref:Efflux pump patC n=1 Tax=Cladobotryum mycophilum TaxID=491253 RepID=A0ABR0SQD9_9HYPO
MATFSHAKIEDSGPNWPETSSTSIKDENVHNGVTTSSRLNSASSNLGIMADKPQNTTDITAKDDSQPMERQSGNSNDQVRQITGVKWFSVCVSLYISALVFGLTTTIAADVRSSVIKDFGHVDQLAWIGAGFPLGSVAVVLPCYITSFVLFELGSAVCGAAPNMDAIIVGRVLAGASGAGLFLGCLNYFNAITTQTERSFYVALINLCWGTGAVLGPIIGGAFSVSSATWRWAFYINLPLLPSFSTPCSGSTSS